MENYKRILQTSAPDALVEALKPCPEIIVRPTKQGDALVIEGPLSRKKVIDKAVELFAEMDGFRRAPRRIMAPP